LAGHFAVPLVITEYDGIRRINEPVTVGIPLPKGQVFNPTDIALYNASNARMPVQSEVLARWSDGSVQWVLVDFLADVAPKTTVEYALRDCVEPVSVTLDAPIPVQESPVSIAIDTGYARFHLNSTVFSPFERVSIQGYSALAEAGSSMVLLDADGREYRPCIHRHTIETTGPLRTTLCMQGVFLRETRDTLAHFVSRLSFYARSGLVELRFTLHNPRAATHPGGRWDLGDAGSVYFRDLALHLPLRLQNSLSRMWTSQPHQPLIPSAGVRLEIYQDSSGGQNWRSTNHVNRYGQVMQTLQGYRVTADDCVIAEGKRATPIVAVGNHEIRVTAAVDKFWQNFPKALEADHNNLRIRLFPQQYHDVYELQGGEQKTHTVWLQFDRQHESAPDINWWHCRLQPQATPEWYARSKALSYLTPRSANKHDDYQTVVDTAIEGHNTFFDRREIIDEYGWRHFGDLYADHEAVGHQGKPPLISHYNNQYDAIYGAVVQYASSGDPRWFALMTDLAKHVIDIDIYHTNEDRPAYNHGLFWHTDHYTDAATATHRSYSQATMEARRLQDYGGGPASAHNYTTGLLHYYYCTGDPLAREAVLGLANWVVNMDDGSHRLFGRFDRRPAGLCSMTETFYHGPGRGAGNSINALLDAFVLTREARYRIKAEELIRRCIHPKDVIAQRHLDNVEHRWSYTVFLQILGKYLDIKVEANEIDYMYSYARASLLHYALWMLEHEVPYKCVLDRVEIPTETWPAQDIRKSNVFKFAAKYAPEGLRRAYLQKGEAFFRACVTDLLSFDTCTLTRPIVILMANGYMQAYFDCCPEEMAPLPAAEYDFGVPQDFTPQFAELYKARARLRAIVHAVRTVSQRLLGRHPSSSANTIASPVGQHVLCMFAAVAGGLFAFTPQLLA
jgi:hypothetical protein